MQAEKKAKIDNYFIRLKKVSGTELPSIWSVSRGTSKKRRDSRSATVSRGINVHTNSEEPYAAFRSALSGERKLLDKINGEILGELSRPKKGEPEIEVVQPRVRQILDIILQVLPGPKTATTVKELPITGARVDFTIRSDESAATAKELHLPGLEHLLFIEVKRYAAKRRSSDSLLREGLQQIISRFCWRYEESLGVISSSYGIITNGANIAFVMIKHVVGDKEIFPIYVSNVMPLFPSDRKEIPEGLRYLMRYLHKAASGDLAAFGFARSALNSLCPSVEEHRYEFERILGVGGFAYVIRAAGLPKSQTKREYYAIKVAKSRQDEADDAIITERKILEAFSKVGEPAKWRKSVPILCAAVAGWFPNSPPRLCLVLQPVGTPLDDYVIALETAGAPRQQKLCLALQVWQDVSAALAGAAAMQIYHHDVRPRNIIIVPERSYLRCVLIDWGCAIRGDDASADAVKPHTSPKHRAFWSPWAMELRDQTTAAEDKSEPFLLTHSFESDDLQTNDLHSLVNVVLGIVLGKDCYPPFFESTAQTEGFAAAHAWFKTFYKNEENLRLFGNHGKYAKEWKAFGTTMDQMYEEIKRRTPTRKSSKSIGSSMTHQSAPVSGRRRPREWEK